MLTLDHTWDTELFNYKLELKIVLPECEEVGYGIYDNIHQINSSDMHMYSNYSDRDVNYMITWVTDKFQQQLSPLNYTEE